MSYILFSRSNSVKKSTLNEQPYCVFAIALPLRNPIGSRSRKEVPLTPMCEMAKQATKIEFGFLNYMYVEKDCCDFLGS